jgi:hypothetical protein
VGRQERLQPGGQRGRNTPNLLFSGMVNEPIMPSSLGLFLSIWEMSGKSTLTRETETVSKPTTLNSQIEDGELGATLARYGGR